MRKIVLDTDVSSLIIKARLSGQMATRMIGPVHVLSFVTRAELLVWSKKYRWGHQKRQFLHNWVQERPTLPGDSLVADVYSTLCAAGEDRGRPRPKNDMWIAACCLAHDLPLATFNVKDFEDFAIHHGLEIVSG